MVGDSAAGKTSLVLRFDQNVFSTKFVTTIGVDYRDKTVTLSNTPLRLQLWDTAGQERFRSLTSNFFGRADGFALAFDLTRRESFDSVRGWMKDINARAPTDVEVVLCGNKADLEEERQVAREDCVGEAGRLALCTGSQYWRSMPPFRIVASPSSRSLLRSHTPNAPIPPPPLPPKPSPANTASSTSKPAPKPARASKPCSSPSRTI